MRAVWIRARAEVGARWRALVSLGVLAGLLGAAVLAAAAGARRTESAYERFLAAARVPQAAVDVAAPGRRGVDLETVRRLPEVAEAREFVYFGFVAKTNTGTSFTAFGDAAGVGGPAPYWGRSFDRPRILDGRLSNPSRADELVVGEAFARQKHLTPGTPVRLQLFDPTTFRPGPKVAVRIVGVVALPGMLPAAPDFTQVLFTPAFYRQHGRAYGMSPYLLVRLRSGQGGMTAFRRAVEAIPGGAGTVSLGPGLGTRPVIERVTRLLALTLWMFAGLAGLAGLLILGQTISRFTFLESTDHHVLRTLGMTTGQLLAVGVVKAGVVGMVGAAVAVGVSVAASPMLPVGLARLAEPSPGLSVDGLVVASGAALLLGTVLALATTAAWRAARADDRARRDADSDVAGRASGIGNAAARAGLRPPLVVGLRMAFEPGRGRTSVPVRSALAAVVMATLALGTNAAFLASYAHWRATPQLYGWNWDAMVGGAFGAPDVDATFMRKLIGHEHTVQSWSAGTIVPQVPLSTAGRSPTVANVWGIDPMVGRVLPPVVQGRWPTRPNEVALGSQTMRDLGAGIGERILVHTTNRTERVIVVGQAVFPELGDGQTQGMGVGAGFTWAGARSLLPTAQERAFLLRFRPGTRIGATIARLDRTPPIDGIVKGPVAGTDIRIYSGVERVPLALGSILALAAVATLVHVLVTAVKRRRRDLAILKVLGFARGEVQAAMAWQATAFTGAALIVGIPLGIAAGRWWWTIFAGRMGIVPKAVIPLAGIGLLLPAGILLANVVAAVPARIAARTRPAHVLRSE